MSACSACFVGRTVDIGDGVTVCTRCRRVVQPAPPAPIPSLVELLDFAAVHGLYPLGVNIRTAFGFSPTRYHQALNRALDNPSAMELRPELVAARRDRRDRLHAARTGSAA